MSEQRLIDSNADVYPYVTTWTCNCSEYGVQNVMAVDDISTLPEIDPESMPIVQRLRDELKRTVIERNTLAVIVYKQCWKDCFLCENGVIKENCGLGYFNKRTRKCMLQEWTGYENENVRLKEPEDYFISKAKGGK